MSQVPSAPPLGQATDAGACAKTASIVDQVNLGVISLDRELRVTLWNRFMEINSGRPASEVLGRELWAVFPGLPRRWLTRKVGVVFHLKHPAFSSWEQRPYLFEFPNKRPITGGIDFMRQDVVFLPVKDRDGSVREVCITLTDVTEMALYRRKLEAAMEELARDSTHDALTGVYNRRHLDQTLATEFKRSVRFRAPLSVFLLDIDHFKRVNDTYGHAAGDQVLTRVARIVTQAVRSTDVFGRFGGEEFLALLPGTPLAGGVEVAERVRVAIAAEGIDAGAERISVTASFGVSEIRSEHQRVEDLVREADLGLYAAKRGGRNRVSVVSVREIAGGERGATGT